MYPSHIRLFRCIIAMALGLALGVAALPVAAQTCQTNFLLAWGSQGNANGQFNQPGGIALDAVGNVYSIDQINNRVQKFDANGNFLLTWGSSGSGSGQFNFAGGVEVDAAGNVYVADQVNNRVQKFDANGNFLLTWGWGVRTGAAAFEICTSNCMAGSFGGGNGQFRFSINLTVDAGGNVYVADFNNNRIQKFDSNGNFLLTWGTFGNADGQLNGPNGVRVDAAGNVYVAEYLGNRIQKFDANGNFLLKWGSAGAPPGQFNNPGGLTIDAVGNVYVADSNNNRIQKFDANGNLLLILGNFGTGPGQLNGPIDMRVDAAGNVYVSDARNFRIEKFGCGATSPQLSDQKAGSLLVFPYYISKAAEQKDTRLTISNIGTQQTIVHLFFIDGASCQQADQYLCLTPNASFAFKTSEYDPETTGWVLAVAVNAQGLPIQNNALIGNAFVKDGDYVDNYGAEAFRTSANTPANTGGLTATLVFNGNLAYDSVPNQFAVEIQSSLDAAGQKIVTVGLSGDLTTSRLSGAAQVGTGQVFNGNEKPFGSFSAWLQESCQASALISTTSPRVPNGLASMIPAGQVGTLKFNVGAAVGLLLTPRTATWKGIRTLHKTQTVATMLTIPIFVPVC